LALGDLESGLILLFLSLLLLSGCLYLLVKVLHSLLGSQVNKKIKFLRFVFLSKKKLFNPFTAEVAIMRLLGSAPKSHLCDQRRGSKVTGLSDLMTLFIDLGCLYCKQTERAFNVFKNTLN
jgi:hypothetical protein